MEILNIKNLSFRYALNKFNSLTNINLSLNEGEFLLLMGESGSGKTTLLRLLKKEITPIGEKTGEIVFKDDLKAGIVTQDVENQLVSDTVWHNIAFGLENMNLPPKEIRQKVSEVAEFFDITDLFHKNTFSLSGGEKQIVSLASVMALDPDILLLDEPTSQLDPIAAKKFFDVIKRVNTELGLTVIISEHRSEDLFFFASKICIMNNGCIINESSPEKLIENFDGAICNAPAFVKLHNMLNSNKKCPMSVGECRQFLFENYRNNIDSIEEESVFTEKIVEMNDIYFRYQKNSPDILNKLSLNINKNEILAILGGNGVGKSTLLSVLQGVYKPYSGKVYRNGAKIVLLPQNVKAVFTKDVLSEDLSLISGDYADICDQLNITHLLNRNPYDLSGGEMQRAALAKVLLTKPDVLCLDEPTKGLDVSGKREVGKILKHLKARGVSVVFVTHDMEFSAEISDRCAFMYDGLIVSEGTPREVFSKNKFYTTTASVFSRHMYKNAVTVDDVVELCKRNGSY